MYVFGRPCVFLGEGAGGTTGAEPGERLGCGGHQEKEREGGGGGGERGIGGRTGGRGAGGEQGLDL